MLSRQENVAKLTQEKVEYNLEQISKVLNSNDSKFKKKNGSWNAVKIAEFLYIDPRTVRKYIKTIEQNPANYIK